MTDALTPGDLCPRCEIRLAIARQHNPDTNFAIGMLFTTDGRLSCDSCEFVETKQREPDSVH